LGAEVRKGGCGGAERGRKKPIGCQAGTSKGGVRAEGSSHMEKKKRGGNVTGLQKELGRSLLAFNMTSSHGSCVIRRGGQGEPGSFWGSKTIQRKSRHMELPLCSEVEGRYNPWGLKLKGRTPTKKKT